MAIPFNVPSDQHAEAALEQIILEIYQLIQILQRSRAPAQIPTAPRVCSSTPRRRSQPSREPMNPDRMQDYVLSFALRNAEADVPRLSARTDLDWLAALPSTLRTSGSGSRLREQRRNRRQRSSSESSCCEEGSKYGGVEEVDGAQDWIQDEKDAETSSRPKQCCMHESGGGGGSIFSKLVPSPIQSSIWTAVICVVGWQLFRAR